MKTLTLYTTRPMREGEKDGVEYYFVSNEILEQSKNDHARKLAGIKGGTKNV